MDRSTTTKGHLRFVHRLSITTLRELIMSEPNDILLHLQSSESGFFERISSESVPDGGVMELLMHAIALSCRSDRSSVLREFLQKLIESRFVKETLAQYLVDRRRNPDEIMIRHVVEILGAMQRFWPSHSISAVSMLLSQVGPAIANQMFESDLLIDLKSVERTMEDNLRSIKLETMLCDQEKLDCAKSSDEPCDFRTVGILPTSVDIQGKERPYLRKNIIYGKYDSVEHYLDVQFLLLREDLIRPLREAIHEVRVKALPGADRYPRNGNIHVYQNVQIVSPCFSPKGLLYLVRFDVSRFRNVCWKETKRLTYGALVCLSKDNFKSLIFCHNCRSKA